jgi:hypothetical protein
MATSTKDNNREETVQTPDKSLEEQSLLTAKITTDTDKENVKHRAYWASSVTVLKRYGKRARKENMCILCSHTFLVQSYVSCPTPLGPDTH